MNNGIYIFLAIVLFLIGCTSKAGSDLLGQDDATKNKEYTDSQHGFSFSYPAQYYLGKDADKKRVSITSIEPRKVNDKKCAALEDEREQSLCRNPLMGVSPSITVAYFPDYTKQSKVEQLYNTYPNFSTKSGSWKVHGFSDEYGGYRTYVLHARKGAYIAKYIYGDTAGGVPFSALKSDKYLLDQKQQKNLIEGILSTFQIRASGGKTYR